MNRSTHANNSNDQRFGAACRVPPFPLGQTVATPGALVLLDHAGINASALLARHQTRNLEDMDEANRIANANAIRNRTRILSVHVLGRGARIWIVTETDRSVTTLLLPEEY